MRVGPLALILVIHCSLARAGDQLSYTKNPSTSSVVAQAGSPCCECDACQQGCGHCGHGGKGGDNRRSADSANCNCNGSYKFPVPPLYTYHWPGRYSQQLMTDYQSPWRFPPLKPYTDEIKTDAAAVRGTVLPTSGEVPNREPELVSEKIIRHYGLK